MSNVVIACDHAGFPLKDIILRNAALPSGLTWLDLGVNDTTPVDYPDQALALAEAIRNGQAARGVLICGSGVGVSVAANKVPGVRAAICHDVYSAHQGVEHDDMNVLVLGARVIGYELALDLVRAFLRAEFSHVDRHVRRLDKVKAMEERFRAE